MIRVGIVILLGSVTILSACTEKAKMGGQSGVSKRPPQTVVSANRDLQTTSIHNVWIVASNGNAYRLTIEDKKVKSSKKWTGIVGAGGTRTYVTEAGFVAARWPYVYFIDPEKTPEGALSASDRIDIKAGDAEDTDSNAGWHPRVCLASYQKADNNRYLIAAWGNGRYREFQMSDTKPYRPNWSPLPPLKIVPEINGWREYDASQNLIKVWWGWGYSCAIDQKRKRFYSQWYASGPKLRQDAKGVASRTGGAIDLETGNFLAPETAYPNAAFVSSHPKLKASTLGVSSDWGSYSVGTDSDGNIYNHRSTTDFLGYTAAHDAVGDFVWITRHGTTTEWPKGKITVARRKCLTSDANCIEKKDFMDFHGPENFIGPLSALKDGTIVGLVRGSGTDKNRVYLLRLEDESDLSKGIRFTKLDYEIDGDPYMYVDFTGATLYTFESEQTFRVREIPGYVPTSRRDPTPQRLQSVGFVWKNKAGTTNEWQNVKLEVRCYLDASSRPAYEEIKITGKAGESSDITTKACQNKSADFIDVKLTRLKGNNLEDISDIQVSITQ